MPLLPAPGFYGFTASQMREYGKACADAERDRLESVTHDLLEALKNLLQDTQHKEHEDCEDGPCPVREAREAVRKATGDAS